MVTVGDRVMSIYGVGTVEDCRDNGAAVVKIESWVLAGGQAPFAYLAEGQFTVGVKNGTTVKSIYGTGVVQDFRKDGTTQIELQSWELAMGQKPIAFLQPGQYAEVTV